MAPPDSATPSDGAADADSRGVVFGRRPVLELLRAGAPIQKVLLARDLARSSVIGEIKRRAGAANVPVRLVPKSEVLRAAGSANHQGVVAWTEGFAYAAFDQLLRAADPALLCLDGVTDPHNLGSLLRSADGAGFTGVVLPRRRSVGVTPAVRRVSVGASEIVPVARVANLSHALDEARRAGVWVVGLDQDATEDIWSSPLMEPPLALVVGAEDRGISTPVRDRCDALLGIPSFGRIESLNVAVAGAIAMFEVARRRGRSDTL